MAQAATGSQSTSIEQPANETKTARKGMIWTGRILAILTVLFMLFDAFAKLAKSAQVLQACARLGIPDSQIVSIGVLLLVSTIIYAIPRTAVLGAVLLTGYLGGAVAIQMRAGSPTFETVFPVIVGVMLWAGVYLRECGLRRVFPVKRG
jgi:hypothetical protein